MRERARHQQRKTERERGGQHRQNESSAAVEKVEEPDAPHRRSFYGSDLGRKGRRVRTLPR
jgi:hypothetical protein